jgi:hypothetical protein
MLILCAGQAAAFDIQIGLLDVGPPANTTAGPHQIANDTVGARVTIPLSFSKTQKPGHTLNGQRMAPFTEQDAEDSLIVIMLFGVALAAGYYTVDAASD